ncbi:hypothetical protein V8B97DRAFT_1915106 [Scleroderma yunnanense]
MYTDLFCLDGKTVKVHVEFVLGAVQGDLLRPLVCAQGPQVVDLGCQGFFFIGTIIVWTIGIVDVDKLLGSVADVCRGCKVEDGLEILLDIATNGKLVVLLAVVVVWIVAITNANELLRSVADVCGGCEVEDGLEMKATTDGVGDQWISGLDKLSGCVGADFGVQVSL